MTICLLVFSLSGCSGNEATPMSEPVVITFAYNEIDADLFETLVQEFNKHDSHIIVKLRSETVGGLANLGADEADVREVWQEIAGGLQEQGDIVELDPFIEADESFDPSDFYPAMLRAYTIEGKTWAIPSGVNPLVVYYNQDLFDQYGVPYPENGWTWDDFLSTALAIRDPEAGVFSYVNLVGPYGPMMFVYQHGGRIFDEIQDPTRTTFDDPLTVEALEWYAQLFQEHDVAPTPEQARRAFGAERRAVERAILENRVGMWTYEFFRQGGRDWIVEWPMRWGMVTLPRDARSATGGMCGGYAISSQTQHRDAAWQWVAFLSRQTRDYVVPVRKSIVESVEYERQVGEDIAALVQPSLESGLFFSPRMYTRFEGTLDLFGEAVDRVTSGDWTAQEAMDWAQQQAERRIGP